MKFNLLTSLQGVITQKSIVMLVHSHESQNYHKCHLHPSSVYSATGSVGNLCEVARMWLYVHPGLQWGISWVRIGNDEQPLSSGSSCTGHCHLPVACSVESACRKRLLPWATSINELTAQPAVPAHSSHVWDKNAQSFTYSPKIDVRGAVQNTRARRLNIEVNK